MLDDDHRHRAGALHVEAVLAHRSTELARAGELYRASLALDETSTVAWFRYSGLLYDQESWVEALHAARNACNRRAGSDRRSFVHHRIASCCARLERWAEHDLASAASGEAYAEDRLMMAVLENRFSVTRCWDESARRLHAVLEVEPENENALDSLGWVYTDAGDLAKAEDCFRRALLIDAAHARATAGLGRALHLQGARSAAVVLLRRSIALAPKDIWCRLYLADSLHDGGDPEQREEARAHYCIAREGWPGCVELSASVDDFMMGTGHVASTAG